MALCYLPCFGEPRIILFRSGIISVKNDKRSHYFPCNTKTSTLLSKRCHSRLHPLNLKQATRTLQKPRDRPAVTSEERSSGSLLTFSFGEGEDNADGGDVDPREQLRRDRIAQANKGRVPWNKGRRHSPETIAKIKERTKTAMLNPQIRDKLRHCGKRQTVETKAKIREKMVGFWEGKRVIRETQALFEREWKEVIAEAARVGASGEEELEWDSYKKVKEKYRLEDVQAERQKKAALRDSLKSELRRKPISDAHRKAISEAITAKWADPEYQARVSAGMAKADADKRQKNPPMHIHKKEVAPGKSPIANADKRQKNPPMHIHKKDVAPGKSPVAIVKEVPVDKDFIAEVLAEEGTLQTRKTRSIAARLKGPQKVTLVSLEDHNDDSEAAATRDQSTGQEEEVAEADVRAPTAHVQLSSKLASQSYKDPLILEKVQRIQQLRQGRLEVELKRKEAADRARMLIANAERAANALEQAGKADAATLATLREARRVLTEATRSVQAAELKPGSSRKSGIRGAWL